NMPFKIAPLTNNTFAILGKNNNYIEIKISSPDEILNDYNGNALNEFLLFQIDLNKEFEKRAPSDDFKNISVIWKKVPESIIKKYKLLLEELEQKKKTSGLE
ncbi:9435_t:CDS:1, partial [Funneliformis caledonium]